MKASLLFKIFLGFAFFIAALWAVILTVSLSTIQKQYTELLSRELENLAVTLVPTFAPLLAAGQSDRLQNLVQGTGAAIEKRITLIDIGGTVIADSLMDPNTMDNHRGRPEIVAALGGNAGRSSRFSTTMGAEMLYVAVPIMENGEVGGVLRVSLYLTTIQDMVHTFRSRIYVTTLVIVSVLLIAAFLFSNRITDPIRQLQDASKRIAQGNFETKVFLKQRGEIKELADSYNYMTEELSKNIHELSRQREELRSIITSIQSGLFVLDKNGKIVLNNKSTEEIVQKTNITGKPYWTVVKSVDLFELVQEALGERTSVSREIELFGHHYQCNATYLPNMEELVIVMHDITGMKRLQRIKRDFVSNVSHEMRTPLTAIKGYAETMQGLDEENESYLNIIRRHTDRLINIVQDLLILSEMEEIGMKLDLDMVDVNETITNIMKIFKHRVEEKGLTIELELDARIPPLRADQLKLEQAFINVIDNAVKYTEKGTIRISTKIIEGFLIVEIQDTGIGIPERHIPRLFERFYTVDKSHSRKLGGTGLGLSIVKHIILLHNGIIDVESESGRGTTFRIDLPLGP
jgi:two-component system phosphate regulon sensor histidine kinase PhoR